jgi:hypothetical protein
LAASNAKLTPPNPRLVPSAFAATVMVRVTVCPAGTSKWLGKVPVSVRPKDSPPVAWTSVASTRPLLVKAKVSVAVSDPEITVGWNEATNAMSGTSSGSATCAVPVAELSTGFASPLPAS